MQVSWGSFAHIRVSRCRRRSRLQDPDDCGIHKVDCKPPPLGYGRRRPRGLSQAPSQLESFGQGISTVRIRLLNDSMPPKRWFSPPPLRITGQEPARDHTRASYTGKGSGTGNARPRRGSIANRSHPTMPIRLASFCCLRSQLRMQSKTRLSLLIPR